MPIQSFEFEVREQEFPALGWIIVAHWPNGYQEQLVGVFTEKKFALEWIRDQGDIWISHRNAELE